MVWNWSSKLQAVVLPTLLFTCSVNQQKSTENLLYTRHYSRLWGSYSEGNRQHSSLMGGERGRTDGQTDGWDNMFDSGEG